MKPGARHSPDALARIGSRTKAAMADPAVRQRISEQTKAGMRRKAQLRSTDMRHLRDAWNEAPAAVRRAFLTELLAMAVGGPLP
jgi:predicted RNase H-like nuclease (RuvC/YqgF family)